MENLMVNSTVKRLRERVDRNDVNTFKGVSKRNNQSKQTMNNDKEAMVRNYLSNLLNSDKNIYFFIYNQKSKGPKSKKMKFTLHVDKYKCLEYKDPIRLKQSDKKDSDVDKNNYNPNEKTCRIESTNGNSTSLNNDDIYESTTLMSPFNDFEIYQELVVDFDGEYENGFYDSFVTDNTDYNNGMDIICNKGSDGGGNTGYCDANGEMLYSGIKLDNNDKRNCNKNDDDDDDDDVVPDNDDDDCEKLKIEKYRTSHCNDVRPDVIKLLQLGFQINSLNDEKNNLPTRPSSSSSSYSSSPPLSSSSSSSSSSPKKITATKRLLSSRACRLKRTAKHEANKIKYVGLKKEQESLLKVMKETLHFYSNKNSLKPGLRFCEKLNQLIQNHLSYMVAGYTDAFIKNELKSAAKKCLTSNSDGDNISIDSFFKVK